MTYQHPTSDDLAALSDADLSLLKTLVWAEDNRRIVLAQTAESITGILADYVAAGGDVAALDLGVPTTPEPVAEPEPESEVAP